MLVVAEGLLLPAEVVARVKGIAGRTDTPRSVLVRQRIMECLEQIVLPQEQRHG